MGPARTPPERERRRDFRLAAERFVRWPVGFESEDWIADGRWFIKVWNDREHAVDLGVLDALAEIGLDETRVMGVPQGWKLSGAIKTCERRLAEGALFHGGSRLMNWCAGNAKVEPRGNAVTITKQLAGYCKIDPLCALFNAAALLSMNPQPRLEVSQWIA